jgi:hypothetical protein
MRKELLLFTLIAVLASCQKAENAAYTSTGKGGSLARFTIVGNYLYTVDKENLKVFDITDGAQPVFKTTIPVGFEIETIFPFRDKLFIGSSSVVYIFSIDDPAKPKRLSEAISPTVMRRCDPVVAKDSVAFATLRTNGPCGGVQSILAVYDIRDVSNPVQRASLPLLEPYGLGYFDNTLYICDKTQLVVCDISSPFEPRVINSIREANSSFIDVVPYNNLLVCWVTDGIIIYDITEKAKPVLVKKII